MRTALLLLSLASTPAFAQTFAESLELARQHVLAGEWEDASELLSALRAANASEADREQLAAVYESLGQGLFDAGVLPSAVTAFEAALAERRRSLGERDHDDVVRLLTRMGLASLQLGRADGALPPFEQALAMAKRLDPEAPTIAAAVNNVAYALMMLGRGGEALPHFEEALAKQLAIVGEGDDPTTAMMRNNLGRCLAGVGRVGEALAQFEPALAMRQRLYGGLDHVDVAASLGDVATCLARLGRAGDALPRYEAALAMVRRLAGGGDHREVAVALLNLGACQRAAGQLGEALATCTEALSMYERLLGGADHPELAGAIVEVADSARSVGRLDEARALYERALAMLTRVHGDRDHPSIAHALMVLGTCFELQGRPGDALPRAEAALAMHRRLFAGDHFATAASLNNVGTALLALGRPGDALPTFEASLAMRQRLLRGEDHTEVAMSLNNVAMCLQRLGRPQDALPQLEAALAMHRRQSTEVDSPEIASSLANVAHALEALGRSAQALPLYEESLAMSGRIHEGHDHVSIVVAGNGIGSCLAGLGRTDEALRHLQDALAMATRCRGEEPAVALVSVLTNTATVLARLGRAREALDTSRRAVAEIERLRDENRVSAPLRQSLFDELKRSRVFERLQDCAVGLGELAVAFDAAERSRSRDLLDVLEQQRFDAFAEAVRRVRRRGDEAAATRLLALQQQLADADLENDRALYAHASTPDGGATDGERTARATAADDLARRRRQLLDERARLLGDVLPVGRVRTAEEIGSVLREGELLLEFAVTAEIGFLYVVGRDGALDVVKLPEAHRTAARVLPGLMADVAKGQAGARGRDPEGAPGPSSAVASAAAAHELFHSLVPSSLWERLRRCKRVFVAPHRDLHALPFELLVTEIAGDRVVPWLDSGPAISYVPSGSALHWMRRRAADAVDDATSLDLLAVGDPRQTDGGPDLPEQGVLVVGVADGSEAARVGLRPGDVLLRYDGQVLADGKRLRELLSAVEAAIEDGTRADGAIPIDVWRRGETLGVEVGKGRLGLDFAAVGARAAHELAQGGFDRVQRITRSGDLERLRRLPPLRGAAAEARAIEGVFARGSRKAKCLLGAEATEPAVSELAPKAKYLHFACHGIAEEYAGQSLSMLMLAQPDIVLPGDDGLLKLGELLGAWGGRLSSCRLVVLSACRTNVGPTNRDDAPQALPLGFLFAGAPAVISSLWAVDDESTRVLMTDFYGRLLAGETDTLQAFREAKKSLRAKYPDPFHWAPFLFVGAPE